jgi:hypothetical protein
MLKWLLLGESNSSTRVRCFLATDNDENEEKGEATTTFRSEKQTWCQAKGDFREKQ